LLNPRDKRIKKEGGVYTKKQERDIRAPSIQALSAVIRKLKNKREPGEDSITAEFIKGGCRMMWRKIHLCTDAECVEETAKAR
jgi:hypothetical protein